jgi:outer membrane scaffolding protein for murein synthesis (MipA/OmpV family)
MNRSHWIALIIGGGVLRAGVSMAESPPGQPMTVAGAGAFTLPRYPGSSAVEVKAFPVLDAERWNRLFIHTGEGVGVYLWRTPEWRVEISVDADPLHRYEKDAQRLHGLGNVDQTERANFLVGHDSSCTQMRLKLSTDLGGQGHGNVADFEMATIRAPLPDLSLRAAVGWTWTNEQYMRTFFGVNARQSALSGLPVFSPDAGVSLVRGVFSARYSLSEHWLVGGLASVGRLLGDAGDSPITQKRTDIGAGVFLAYTWKEGCCHE